MEPPHLFRCPISMEIMEDPVTVSTGVTYDRRSIERWLFVYKKFTCPATMQPMSSLELTPNQLLKRLIDTWQQQATATSPPSSSSSAMLTREKLASVLADVDSTPFKVSSLKTLRACMEKNSDMQQELIRSGGIQSLGKIITQAVVEANDFTAFRACEEAIGVLSLLPLTEEPSLSFFLEPEFIKQMLVVLQTASIDARLNTISILTKILQTGQNPIKSIGYKQEDFIKVLLELLSDEGPTKLSASALDLLLEIVAMSKSGKLKAIELGAVAILIELLPDSARHQSERILLMLERLSKCPEGRAAFEEHRLGVASVGKKILRMSEVGTKLSVKILWLLCNYLPTERLLDEMVVFGVVEKLIGLMHMNSQSSTKQKAMKIVRMHAAFWRQYPCFPNELRDYLRSV